MTNQHEPRNERTARRAAPLPPLDRYYMPAMPPVALIEAVARRFGEWRRRRDLRRLLRYEDRMLQDLGYERGEILRALSLPLKDNALRALIRCRPPQGRCRPRG